MAEYVTHARLSPSGSKRWMACPGSVALEAPFPDTASTFSDDGTAMHTVAAWCLTEHRRAHLRIEQEIAVHNEGQPPRYVTFTEDMADLVQGYVDTVRMLGIGNLLQVEQRVNFSPFVGVADQFGTADAIIWNDRDGELMLVDLKTGYKFVDAEENSQLLCYALGALKQIVEGTGPSSPTAGVDQATADFVSAQAADIIAEVGAALGAAPAVDVPEAAVSQTHQAEEGDDDELW